MISKYTHLAEIYGVPCYYHEYTGEIEGTSWINERLIALCVWFDITFNINDGFYIKLTRCAF